MAVREPDRLFVNGVDLGKRWFLTVESTYQMPAQVRDGLVETPGRHGARGSGRPPLYDVGAGKLVLHVGGEGRGHLREVLDELIGLLTGGSEVVLMHASGGQSRQAVIEVQSWSVTERVPQVFADLEVSYVVPGVFLRSLNTLERSVPAGSSVLPREGTAPVTDAVVRFAGPSAGSHTITEGVWGTGATWTGSLVSGQCVFIDPRAMRAWQGAAIDWRRPASARDVSTSLSPATAGPLALHHTTGWGQGAVTATNHAHDPFLTHTPVGAEMSGAQSTMSSAPVVNRAGKKWAAVQSEYASPGSGYLDFESNPTDSMWAGKHVYFSATLDMTPEALAGGARPYLLIHYRDADNGPLLSTSTGRLTEPGVYDLSLDMYVPDVAGQTVYIRAYHGAAANNPPVYYRDFYLSETPGAAFDGDTPDTDELVYEWTGTPGASASTVGPRALVRSTPLTASKAATIRYKEAWL